MAAVIFGWPAVIASIALALAGVATTRTTMVLAGAFVACPFLFYLFLTPRFQWVAPPAAVLLFLAVRAVARKRRGTALLLVAPYVGLAVFAAYLTCRSINETRSRSLRESAASPFAAADLLRLASPASAGG